MARIVYLATDPITAYRLMDGQLAFMRRAGHDVVVVTSPGELLDRAAEREAVRKASVPMRRELSPFADVVALARLTKLLVQLKPEIVNAGTPKAGLLGVIAARLAGTPVVVYLLRGLRFEGAKGMKRLVLAATEHVSGHLAHRVFANSQSLKARFVALGCAPAEKLFVPLSGSSNGVDVERFAPSDERRAWAADKRRELGIPADAIVVGFVGRLVRDKGIVELLAAFREASDQDPRLFLLLVGEHDATDPLPPGVWKEFSSHRRIRQTGFVAEPASFYALMNVFAFPSIREGFPNAVLEASSAGVAVVAARATGSVDAVKDGVTGTIVPPRDHAALASALLRYAQDGALREAHGAEGLRRARHSFAQQHVWEALEAEYRKLLADARRPAKRSRASG